MIERLNPGMWILAEFGGDPEEFQVLIVDDGKAFLQMGLGIRRIWDDEILRQKNAMILGYRNPWYRRLFGAPKYWLQRGQE